jgi:predicted anti-sigma-YlaC factor YlaD
MSHQPFDNWLLSEEPLSVDDERTLREHLADCEHCRELEDAWLEVASLFAEVPEVDPAPGFVNRWQATLETDQAALRAVRHRWQSWIVLVLIANGAVLALLLMGVQLFNTYDSVTDWILSWVYKAATAMMLATGFRNVFATLFRTLTQVVPTGWWIGIALTLIVSTLLWIFSMSKLSSLPRRTL